MQILAFGLGIVAFASALYGRHNRDKLMSYPRESDGRPVRGYRRKTRRRQWKVALSCAVGLAAAGACAYLLAYS